ncbi:MAG: glycosyltransferase family 9 protein [Candidatus Omnitrophota bacterium]
MNKVLIFNPLGIGDVLFSTPLIRGIQENFPRASIAYICNKRTYEIMKDHPFIEKMHIFEKDDFKREWRVSKISCLSRALSFFNRLKKDRFDTVIDLSLGSNYTFLFLLMGIPDRVGFNFRNRGRFLTKRFDISGFERKHAIEYYLDLARLVNAVPKEKNISLYILENDRQWGEKFLSENGVMTPDIIVGMVPGCGASWGKDADYRRWGREKFAEVGNRISEDPRVRLLLFGDAGEVDICDDIARAMKRKPLVVCGKTTLRQFLSLVSRCSLVITNDGGPLHIAVGLGVKTVSIFGPVDEDIYGPYPKTSEHIVISKKDLPCRPCYKNFKYSLCGDRECLRSISPGEVFHAAKSMIDSIKKKVPAA